MASAQRAGLDKTIHALCESLQEEASEKIVKAMQEPLAAFKECVVEAERLANVDSLDVSKLAQDDMLVAINSDAGNSFRKAWVGFKDFMELFDSFPQEVGMGDTRVDEATLIDSDRDDERSVQCLQ